MSAKETPLDISKRSGLGQISQRTFSSPGKGADGRERKGGAAEGARDREKGAGVRFDELEFV